MCNRPCWQRDGVGTISESREAEIAADEFAVVVALDDPLSVTAVSIATGRGSNSARYAVRGTTCAASRGEDDVPKIVRMFPTGRGERSSRSVQSIASDNGTQISVDYPRS